MYVCTYTYCTHTTQHPGTHKIHTTHNAYMYVVLCTYMCMHTIHKIYMCMHTCTRTHTLYVVLMVLTLVHPQQRHCSSNQHLLTLQQHCIPNPKRNWEGNLHTDETQFVPRGSRETPSPK